MEADIPEPSQRLHCRTSAPICSFDSQRLSLIQEETQMVQVYCCNILAIISAVFICFIGRQHLAAYSRMEKQPDSRQNPVESNLCKAPFSSFLCLNP